MTDAAGHRRLASLCARFGRDVLLTQAAGGNVSVKLDGKRLLVKQSGFRLRDVRAGAGLSLVDYAALASGVRRSRWASLGYAARQTRHAELIARAAADSRRAPSMETTLHALLPQRWVAHLHSLASVLLGALPKGEALERLRAALGPGVTIHRLPPVLPGLDLALAIDKIARRAPRGPAFWLLENHGAIWAATTADELERLVDAVERRLRSDLDLGAFPPAHSHRREGFCFCRWPSFSFQKRSFTPDYAVYSTLAMGAAKIQGRVVSFGAGKGAARRDARELVFSQALLGTVGKRLGGLKAFPASMTRRVTRMEAERARMRAASGGR